MPLDARAPAVSISTDALLDHWQGHRRVTRRVIEAFPEAALAASRSAGCGRFGAGYRDDLDGERRHSRMATGEWSGEHARAPSKAPARPRGGAASPWDQITAQIDELWPQIPAPDSRRSIRRSGSTRASIYGLLLYWIDNEIHHRGQGYVYLRSLGIEPPAFYDRS